MVCPICHHRLKKSESRVSFMGYRGLTRYSCINTMCDVIDVVQGFAPHHGMHWTPVVVGVTLDFRSHLLDGKREQRGYDPSFDAPLNRKVKIRFNDLRQTWNTEQPVKNPRGLCKIIHSALRSWQFRLEFSKESMRAQVVDSRDGKVLAEIELVK